MSLEEPLRPRQEAILRVVVERYIATGTPVGSKNIAGRDGIDFASSTVRYELARLEQLGYLGHPHTSAGRVPTDRGYRHYTDVVLAREQPATSPSPALAQALDIGAARREVDAAMERLVDVVSQVTSLLGIITAPAPQSSTVRHIEVLVLQPQLVMVVVITSTGAVTKRIFGFDGPVDRGLADWAGSFLNERLVGLSVGARMIAGRLDDPSLSAVERRFLSTLAPAFTELDEDMGGIYIGGRARFLAEQRHQELEAIDALMETLEERYRLLDMLRGALSRNEVYLRIGAELPDHNLAGLSMVAANYGVARRNLGTVSLFGPTRMDYRLAMATVREAAQVLSRYVEEVFE